MAEHSFCISIHLEHQGKVEMAVHSFCISILLEQRGKVEIPIFITVQNQTAVVTTNDRTITTSEIQKMQKDMAVVYCSPSLALTHGCEENHGRTLT